MPDGDNTGPMGRGSLTGRGFGNCRNANEQRLSMQFRRGHRNNSDKKMGNGRQFLNNAQEFQSNTTNKLEGEILDNEISLLRNQLSQIEERLSNLNKEKEN